MWIFHCHVSLPEGKASSNSNIQQNRCVLFFLRGNWKAGKIGGFKFNGNYFLQLAKPRGFGDYHKEFLRLWMRVLFLENHGAYQLHGWAPGIIAAWISSSQGIFFFTNWDPMGLESPCFHGSIWENNLLELFPTTKLKQIYVSFSWTHDTPKNRILLQ